jgi:hypothetical protein
VGGLIPKLSAKYLAGHYDKVDRSDSGLKTVRQSTRFAFRSECATATATTKAAEGNPARAGFCETAMAPASYVGRRLGFRRARKADTKLHISRRVPGAGLSSSIGEKVLLYMPTLWVALGKTRRMER